LNSTVNTKQPYWTFGSDWAPNVVAAANYVVTLTRVTNERAMNWVHLFYYYYYFDPCTQFPGNEKNHAMQYKKVQKSSWNEPYSFSSSFAKQSCSKMALYR